MFGLPFSHIPERAAIGTQMRYEETLLRQIGLIMALQYTYAQQEVAPTRKIRGARAVSMAR